MSLDYKPKSSEQSLSDDSESSRLQTQGASLTTAQDEWSLLDVVVPLALNWKKLLAAVVVAGLLGYFASYLISPRYQAEASLRLDAKEARAIEAIMKSPAALNALIKKYPDLPGSSLQAKRRELAANISVLPSGSQSRTNATIHSLYVVDTNPERAKAIADGLILSWISQSGPQGIELQRMQDQLKRLQNDVALIDSELVSYQTLFRNATETAKQKTTSIQPTGSASASGTGLGIEGSGSKDRSLDAIAGLIVGLRRQREELLISKDKLEPLIKPKDLEAAVLSAPEVPTQQVSPRRARIAGFSALAGLLAMVAYILMRYSWLRAASDPSTSRKLRRTIDIAKGNRFDPNEHGTTGL